MDDEEEIGENHRINAEPPSKKEIKGVIDHHH